MMQINIKTIGTELTEAIRAYVNDKLGSVDKFLAGDADEALMDVELERTTSHHNKGDVYRAAINLSFGGHNLRAESTTNDLYACVDKARDGLVREVKGVRNRRESLFRRGGRAIKNLLRRS